MSTTRETVINCLRQNISYLNEKFYVKKIAIFGSFAADTATENSDVDLMVEFERPIGLKFVELCDYLEFCLNRKVDVLTLEGVANIHNRSVANRIIQNLIYV